MTVPTISNLPTVPATSDPNFETEAPALFNHIKNTFVSEMNSAISFINSSTFDATVEFKNANFTAARNFLYMIDTSSAGVSVTLPLNPSTGDQLLLMDQKRSFGTNNLTIVRNGQNINGAASNVVSKSTGALIRCIFQSSYGWTVDLYEGEWESGTNAGDLVYNGGNVGIGTSSPSTTLDVKSVTAEIRAESTGSGNTGSIAIQTVASSGTGTGYGAILAGNESSSGTASYMSVLTRNSSGTIAEKMRITSDGDVELSKLAGRSYSLPSLTSVNPNFVTGANFNSIPVQVGDEITFYNNQVRTVTAVTNTQLTVDQNWTTSFAATSATGKAGIGFNTKDTERMRITADGKVGIGTSAPSYPFEVKKVSGTGTAFGVTDSSNTLLGSIYVDQSQGSVFVGADNAGTNKVFLSSYGDSYLKGGNVGIGTSSPSGNLHIESDSTSATNLVLKNTATGGREYHLNCTANLSSIGGGNFALRDVTANAYRMVIDSSGNVEVNTGNLVIGTAGKGIDFGVASGSVTSQLLDDYEEGTFTPTVSGTWTTNPTTLSGKYTKIGRMVYIQVEMTGGVKSSSISGYLTGLPIAVASSGTGSVTNVDVQDLGNCLFANTDRIWFTATNLGTAKIYITGQYIAS